MPLFFFFLPPAGKQCCKHGEPMVCHYVRRDDDFFRRVLAQLSRMSLKRCSFPSEIQPTTCTIPYLRDNQHDVDSTLLNGHAPAMVLSRSAHRLIGRTSKLMLGTVIVIIAREWHSWCLDLSDNLKAPEESSVHSG